MTFPVLMLGPTCRAAKSPTLFLLLMQFVEILSHDEISHTFT